MPSDNCKIVAVFADGSGAGVFLIKNGLVGELIDSPYKNEKSCWRFPTNKEWLEDAHYSLWAYLPDNFKLWGEDD